MQILHLLNVATIAAMVASLAACSDSSSRATGMTDDELETAIEQRLKADPQLQAYNISVDADAEERKVTLSGEVPTQSLRSEAVRIAKDSGADLIVEDKIDVDPSDVARERYTEEMAREAREEAKRTGDTIGSDLEDAWLHTKIRTKLVGEGQFPFGSLNVDVERKIVTLRGSVESQEAKMEVERIAKQTDGVAQVRNQLVIKKG